MLKLDKYYVSTYDFIQYRNQSCILYTAVQGTVSKQNLYGTAKQQPYLELTQSLSTCTKNVFQQKYFVHLSCISWLAGRIIWRCVVLATILRKVALQGADAVYDFCYKKFSSTYAFGDGSYSCS
ncbi:Hypothetical_protein [Hexamita inflata]|uniref:Hypothetical_protein n=1 Tax=Hexamita inflata TaxID=28002 RepID=A0AA86NDV3_9EUKA|nr:Hypothetical protein HINF_LOCUS5602 [Hexamita inflata]